MTRLILVRHGETAWNHQNRYQGQTDIELSEVGREQARQLGRRLATMRIDAAYSSDLRRCSETAAIALAGRDVPLQTMVDLREINLGRWQGHTGDEVVATWPDEWAAVRADPIGTAPVGGETRLHLQQRVVGALGRIVDLHPAGDVLVVSHGGALYTVACWVVVADLRVGGRLRVYNCGISVVEVLGGVPAIVCWNDTSHLSPDAGPPRHRHQAE